MDQSIIDRAVNIANAAADRGDPVERVIWIPPQTAAANPEGAFAVSYLGSISASDTMPWHR